MFQLSSTYNFVVLRILIFIVLSCSGTINQHERREASKDTKGDLKALPKKRQVYLMQIAYSH